ncbi:MAG: HAD-IIIA family hydrolase [Planctomycetes bacterium]|nr:HAD-IIIA family hydrolase [Planctomycetota bacterium]
MQNTTATERGSGFTAVVLMGGQGRRLASVVADRSKPMALVDGEPFVLRVLDQLAAAGCAKAILATGHHGAAAEAELGTEHAGMALVASREAAPLGTAGAVRLALEHTSADAVLVCNGDSHVDADLAAFVRWAAARDGAAALLAVRVACASRYGAVAVASDGRVLGFREKGVTGPGAVSAGVLWLPRAALQGVPLGTAASLEHDVLPALVAAELHALVVDAPFLDIGVPEAYAAAAAHFAACAQRRARPRQGLLVVDRDGTLIEERHYLADPAGVRLLPGVVDGLRAFAARGYELAVVTNQSGIGRGKFGQAELAAVHAELLRQLAAAGIAVRGIWHCPHHPELGCACRKPEPALLEQALAALGYAPAQCLVVGDKACDVELGARLGTRTALVRTGYGAGTERDGLCAPDLVVDDFAQLAAAVAAAGAGPGGGA